MKKTINNEFHNDNCKKVQKKDGPFSFLMWLFKIEFIILVVVLLIYFFPNKIKFIVKYNIGKHFLNSTIEEKNISKFEEALESNKYLSKNDKEIISTLLKKEIEENIEYIDLNQCNKKIEKLKVLRDNEKYKIDDDLRVAGSYSKTFNQIVIYKNNGTVLFHELNHLISDNKFSSMFNIDFLAESVNEHFTQEYIENSDVTGYENYIFYSYAIAELLPEDVIKKYKFSDNENFIVKALLDIDDNLDKAYDLIDSIKINENSSKFHDSYNHFYNKKYNKNMEDDFILLFYFYNSPVQTNKERKYVRDYLGLSDDDEIVKVVPKGYFSEEYKSKHKECIIEYIKNGNKETLSI